MPVHVSDIHVLHVNKACVLQTAGEEMDLSGACIIAGGFESAKACHIPAGCS